MRYAYIVQYTLLLYIIRGEGWPSTFANHLLAQMITLDTRHFKLHDRQPFYTPRKCMMNDAHMYNVRLSARSKLREYLPKLHFRRRRKTAYMEPGGKVPSVVLFAKISLRW